MANPPAAYRNRHEPTEPFADWTPALRDNGDGRTLHVAYDVGETRRLAFGRGESMTRDLANVGDADLIFTTIEYLGSANPPLPLDAVRRAA